MTKINKRSLKSQKARKSWTNAAYPHFSLTRTHALQLSLHSYQTCSAKRLNFKVLFNNKSILFSGEKKYYKFFKIIFKMKIFQLSDLNDNFNCFWSMQLFYLKDIAADWLKWAVKITESYTIASKCWRMKISARQFHELVSRKFWKYQSHYSIWEKICKMQLHINLAKIPNYILRNFETLQ